MERANGLVSVIIPCYNHGSYLNDAIHSILCQTYKKYEIIVVDDGSDDPQTKEILDNIKNPEIAVYHKENGDVASARNFGIRKSKGEYILTLDADDTFAPSFVEKAVGVLKKNPGVGMVTSYVKRFGKGDQGEAKCTGGGLAEFLQKNQAVACLLFRYTCWMEAGGYDEEIPGFEDWDFAIGVTRHGWTVYSIPEFLFFYRKVNGSMYTRVMNDRPQIINFLVDKYRKEFEEHMSEVIYSRELLISSLSRELNLYKNSFSQKVGNAILSPLKLISKSNKVRAK